jgi:hypothetical protein
LSKSPKKQYVLVTTAHRGVFAGYLEGKPDKTVTLTKARNCIYWSSDVKGFLGLAATGPTKSCKIGPAVPSLVLYEVTAVVWVEPAAVAAWEKAPWQL